MLSSKLRQAILSDLAFPGVAESGLFYRVESREEMSQALRELLELFEDYDAVVLQSRVADSRTLQDALYEPLLRALGTRLQMVSRPSLSECLERLSETAGRPILWLIHDIDRIDQGERHANDMLHSLKAARDHMKFRPGASETPLRLVFFGQDPEKLRTMTSSTDTRQPFMGAFFRDLADLS